jgi:hypothetical protein
VDKSLLPDGHSEIVLRPGRVKTILLLCFCLIFPIGPLIRTPAPDEWYIWLIGAFFGLCALVFAVQLIPSSTYLRLSPQGFTVRSLFRTAPMILWRDVSEFQVAVLPRQKLVVYESTATTMPTLRKINRALVGAGEALPNSFGLKPQELADLMNAWRQTYWARERLN